MLPTIICSNVPSGPREATEAVGGSRWPSTGVHYRSSRCVQAHIEDRRVPGFLPRDFARILQGCAWGGHLLHDLRDAEEHISRHKCQIVEKGFC